MGAEERDRRFAWLAAVAAIAGIPAALVAGRPISAIAVALLTLAIPVGLLAWAALANGRPWYIRATASLASLNVLSVVAFALVVPTSREFVVYQLLGVPKPPAIIHVGGTEGTDERGAFRRLRIHVANPGGEPLVLQPVIVM
jgi:hypothetical protein